MDIDNSFSDIISSLMDRLLEAKGVLFTALEHALDKFLELAMHEKVHLSERIKALLSLIKGKIDFDPLKQLIAKIIGAGNNS